MNKTLKCILWMVVLVFIGYKSIYFKKLDSMKAVNAGNFNAAAYASNYLNITLPGLMGKAIPVDRLLANLQSVPQKTFDTYSNALDIGTIRFFWVKGRGGIVSVNEENVTLQTDSTHAIINIATEYVFGNAVRDATGLIHINDFGSTADLNNISAEINKLIRRQVLPPFKAKAKKGDEIEFSGAVELNSAHLDVTVPEFIPVSLKIMR